MDLISVIIPVYNTKEYVGRCIESILNQSYTKLEVIVVNDGSTDGSLDVINKYAQQDSRIKVIDKINEGVSKARNTALSEANGMYVQFVDSDDFLEVCSIEKMHDAIVKSGADIAICGIRQQFADRAIERRVTDKELVVNACELKEYLYSFDITASSVNKLYKHELLEGMFYPEQLTTAEDFVFNRYLFAKSSKVVLLPQLLYINYQRETSACHRIFTKKLIDENYLAIRTASQIPIRSNDSKALFYWNMVPALLLFTVTHAVILKKQQNSDKILRYLVENEYFWEYYNLVVFKDKKAQIKNNMLAFLLKHKLYKTAIWISSLYDNIKRK